MSLTLLTKSPCVVCPKASSMSCSACKDVLPLPSESRTDRVYCSTKCQKIDWKKHKGPCKSLQERRRLYRAGELLQEILYCFREKVFDRNVERINLEDGRMTIHDLEPAAPAKRLGFLQRVPVELCSTEEDIKSLLAAVFCCDSVAWLHDAVTYVLRGVACHIEERSFRHRDPTRRIINTTDPPTKPPKVEPYHITLKVALNISKESYAFDLTSAQYGYYEPVVPWESYWEERGEEPVASKQSGTRRLIRVSNLRERNFGSMLSLICYEVAGTILPRIVQWEYAEHREIDKMLDLPKHDFEEKMIELLRCLERAMDDKLVSMDNWRLSQSQ
ncbi:hypothetical protein B2J93_5778 [Marssonina coronariae]|uniref:MYND-type domain-containing protein n=1 Tax=Diplocarpon coronariae TaxID=2795749 RepID=A0A218YX13_9HELO|nr:hypothetical protein B2J93_5778 [Marssonina coronariae]